MKGRADAEPDNTGGQTLSLTFLRSFDRSGRFNAAPLLGSVRSITGHHIQTSLFSLVMMLAMVILAVLALLIFCYMSSCGNRASALPRMWRSLLAAVQPVVPDRFRSVSDLRRDTAAGSAAVSFYAFMLMPILMVHFVRANTTSGTAVVPEYSIGATAPTRSHRARYRLGIRFIDYAAADDLLLAAGVAADRAASVVP